jgi:hypothetical protein
MRGAPIRAIATPTVAAAAVPHIMCARRPLPLEVAVLTAATVFRLFLLLALRFLPGDSRGVSAVA